MVEAKKMEIMRKECQNICTLSYQTLSISSHDPMPVVVVALANLGEGTGSRQWALGTQASSNALGYLLAGIVLNLVEVIWFEPAATSAYGEVRLSIIQME